MRKALIALPLVLLAAAGGYVAAQHVAANRLQDSIANLRAALGPDGTLTYATATPNALMLGADLSGITLKQGGNTAEIAQLHITGSHRDGARHIEADTVRLTAANGWLSAEHATLDKLVAPVPVPGVPDAPDAVVPLSFDHLVLRKAHAHDNASGTDLAADMVALHDYGLGRPGGVTLDGMTLASTGTTWFDHILFHRWQADGIDLASWVAHVRAGQKPTVSTGNGAVTADDVAFLKDGKALATIAHVHGTNAAGAPGIVQSRMDVNGMVLDQAAVPDMKQLGYQQLHVELSLQQQYAETAHTLSIAPLKLSVAEAGSVAIDASLANVPAAGAALLPQLPGIQIVSLGVTYTDASLAGRAIDALAKANGIAPEQLRAQSVAALQARQQAMPPAFAPVLQAAAQFLQKPGAITVAMAPKPPMAAASVFMALNDPETAAQLNLSANVR